jgi:hypothetical protein
MILNSIKLIYKYSVLQNYYFELKKVSINLSIFNYPPANIVFVPLSETSSFLNSS